jgi:hypothetical protein
MPTVVGSRWQFVQVSFGCLHATTIVYRSSVTEQLPRSHAGPDAGAHPDWFVELGQGQTAPAYVRGTAA